MSEEDNKSSGTTHKSTPIRHSYTSVVTQGERTDNITIVTRATMSTSSMKTLNSVRDKLKFPSHTFPHPIFLITLQLLRFCPRRYLQHTQYARLTYHEAGRRLTLGNDSKLGEDYEGVFAKDCIRLHHTSTSCYIRESTTYTDVTHPCDGLRKLSLSCQPLRNGLDLLQLARVAVILHLIRHFASWQTSLHRQTNSNCWLHLYSTRKGISGPAGCYLK